MTQLTSRDGTMLGYDQTGPGTPLILVYGAMTLAGQMTMVPPEVLAPVLIAFYC